MTAKVLVTGFRFHHHTKYGGYDKIGENPQVRYVSDKTMPFASLFGLSKYRRIPLFALDVYSRILFVLKDYDILHYVHTEDQFRFPRFWRGKKKIIGTVHLDPVSVEDNHSWKRNKAYLRFVHSFDLFIAMSSELARVFNSRYGVKTIFIPHGFSKPVFTTVACRDIQGNRIDETKVNVFFSGINYRDYDALLYTVKNTDNKNLCFHIIGQKEKEKQLFAAFENTAVYNKLTDDEYFSVLDACDYNFLPVTFATANNVLMEAQGLGVTSILPSIGGILDYAAPEPLNIFYHDKNHVLDIFNQLQKANHKNEIAEFSKKFNWENVYKELNALYDSLMKQAM